MKTLTDWGSNDRSLQQDRHLGAGPNSSVSWPLTQMSATLAEQDYIRAA